MTNYPQVSVVGSSDFAIQTTMHTPAREKSVLTSSDVDHSQYATPSPRYGSTGAVNSISCASCGSTATDVTLSCSHAMCSGCFTASLNIVGEKPFSCPTCFEPIRDFRFTSSVSKLVQSPTLSTPDIQPPVASGDAPDVPSLHDSFEYVPSKKYAVLRLDDVPWVRQCMPLIVCSAAK
jgi:hypothetical protein